MATTIDIRIRGDTAANWETKNPILKQRELGYDMTAKRLKVGDGLTAWKDLAYVAPDVINDLVTGGVDKALSAEQGKNLANNKADKTELTTLEQTLNTTINNAKVTVEDNLTSTSASNALSANQGKVLKELIDTQSNDTVIIDRLTSNRADAALSAKQGKELKSLIDEKADSSKITNITSSLTSLSNIVVKTTDLTSATWRFTLENGSTVDKEVALWSS